MKHNALVKLLPLATAIVTTGTALAQPLVYEPFNYSAGSTLGNITPNGSTIGLDTTVAYGGSNANGYTVQAASLPFAGLQTSGGSVSIASGTGVASGRLALASSPFSGTLFTSYLVSLSARGGGAADGATMRVSNDTSSGGDRFNAQADSRASSTNVAINYGGGTSGVTNTGVSLTLNIPYLIIARFTNVGLTLTGGNPGVATIYALTEAQFGSFAAGGANEAYLDGASVSGGSSDITARISDPAVTTGTFDFATGNFAALVSVNDASTFDEVRYGSTLDDVTTVPEPGSALLALFGGTALLLRRRR